MRTIILICILLCLVSGVKAETIEIPHPSRELSKIPIVKWFDAYAHFTSRIKWRESGFTVIFCDPNKWDYSNPDFYGMSPTQDYFSYVDPELTIGTKDGEVPLKDYEGWMILQTGYCRECGKLIPFPKIYDSCPACEEEEND